MTITRTFHIEAIPADELDRMRARGADEAGNAFTPFVTYEPDGSPLRCCLRMARTGEAIAVIAYAPPGTAGAYREVGPVFVHAEPCDGYRKPGTWPAEFRDRKQVLRAYDEQGRIADALVIDASDAETGLARLFADPATAVVHSRNVAYGCFMFAIRRDPAGGAVTSG